jgi:acetyl-CoA carboxylase biotin carboxyl carrier protein
VVHEGDQIGEGDTLVLLESMKMEIPVLAEVAGTISKVSVAVGDVIQAGDLIAVIS